MNKFLLTIAVLSFLSFDFAKKKDSPQNDLSENTTFLKVTPESFIKNLPGQLKENSGLIFYDDLLWTFNDSGGEHKIFGFDFSGKIKKEIKIDGAKNNDWEDIAQDKKYIYVGDFGNNSGKRNNLIIYKIKKKDIGKKKEQKVDSEEIKFEYENQKDVDYPKKDTPFDCEAIVELKKRLYIFTKDRSDQTTTVYQIPKEKGEYKITPIGKFDVKGLITGADISPNKMQLALLGYKNYMPILWLFSDFTSDNFFDGKKTFIDLSAIPYAQTEGICFLGNDSILISCERTLVTKEQVFLIDLKTLE